MKFQRARSQEQKNIRIHQIVEATLYLYEKQPYDKITLALIAEQLNFSRANLYKYVSTKEEIFLLIITEDIKEWVADVMLFFEKYESIDTVEFCKYWAQLLYHHKRVIELFAILGTIIEQNVSVEKLAVFKKQLYQDVSRMDEIFNRLFSDMSTAQLRLFIQYQMNYAVGLYSGTTPCENQKKAIELSGIPFVAQEFEASFALFLNVAINGIRNTIV